MKSIKCSKCGKTAEVEDGWVYSRCENCRTKDLAYKQVQKEKRRLDREARNRIEELKLERAMNFREWSKFAKEKLHNPDPTWDQFNEYLKQRKEREIYEKAESETYRLKAGYQKKCALVNPDLFPLSHGRECYAFRLSRLNGSKDILHLDSCEDCRDWDYNFVNSMLPERQDERDNSEYVDPIEKWELEQWRSRGATVPDNSLDRFKTKEEPESRDPNQINYQPNEPLDPQKFLEETFYKKPKQQHSQENSKGDIQGILKEYNAQKRDSKETQNNENKDTE